jgi:heavy metal translocating P-type ATPase
VIVVRTVLGVLRGHWASDIIASLAIVTAVVMQQPIPGLIVVLMQTGGEALERFAEGRASNAVRALEADRPQHGHVLRDETVIDVAVGAIAVGNVLIVRPGELVPCDGVVIEGNAEIDTSRLTGEPLPVGIAPGVVVHSGSLNGSRPFTMRTSALAAASQYERIVELVRSAQSSKASFQRLADRYAIWFTPVTLVLAVGAAITSGDAERMLAVLVVATPCPLILAPPIAMIGGMNQAARRQIIMRTGGAIEQLARVTIAVFDKTGTLTNGKPAVSSIGAYPPFTRTTLLELAGSVEQGSGHLLARTVVEVAVAEGVALSLATNVVESAGRGVIGSVGANRVAVGSRSYIVSQLNAESQQTIMAATSVGLTAYVAVNGVLAGTITYADQLRPGIDDILHRLRSLGILRMVLLTGDHAANGAAVGSAVGISEVHSDLTPEDKVRIVEELTTTRGHVMMVGDGTNDAPALSSASIGVALAGHGGGVAAEAADVVILTDDLSRLADAMTLSQRTMMIARQSMWTGLGLSMVAMLFAAAGWIAPTAGALLQELIDVAAIVNALRASAKG